MRGCRWRDSRTNLHYPARGARLAWSSPQPSRTAPVRRTHCPNRRTLCFPRVALNFLLIYLGGFVNLSGYAPIIVGDDLQFFPFAGMLPQLECSGKVLAAPP